MPYKPMVPRDFNHYLSVVGWKLKKGGFDWSVFDENDIYVCTIQISHGNTKQEVPAFSVRKVEKEFRRRGLKWPPDKKSKKS